MLLLGVSSHIGGSHIEYDGTNGPKSHMGSVAHARGYPDDVGVCSLL